jgi:hypothetical protein
MSLHGREADSGERWHIDLHLQLAADYYIVGVGYWGTVVGIDCSWPLRLVARVGLQMALAQMQALA